MITVDENKKQVTVTEYWTIEDVKCVESTLPPIYDSINITDEDRWIVLKNAAEKAQYWNENLTEQKIYDEFETYLEDKLNN